MPLVASALISVVAGVTGGSVIDSPEPVLERTSARDLRPARAIALAMVTAYGIILLVPGALIYPEYGALWREPAHFLAGLGLALLCARHLVLPLTWCVVLAYALACLLIGGALPAYSWLLLFDATGTWPRLGAAAAVWLVGSLSYVINAPRPSGSDDQHWWQ